MTDLVEVFSVQLFNYQNKGSIKDGEIYGAIMGSDYDGSTVLFKQGQRHSENILLPDGTLSLSGPSRCIQGGCWDLRLKLYLKKNQEVLEICNGYVKIYPVSSERFLDKPMSATVCGRDGYAVVNMVTLTSAVQATIEVSSVGNIDHALYGHIRAQNDLHDYRNANEFKYFQTTLFSASQNKPSYMKGKKVPLSRCVMPVPVWGYLIIDAQLFDLMNPTSPVADKQEYFLAQPRGEETRIIISFRNIIII